MVDILTRRPNNGASQEICTPENPLVRQLKMVSPLMKVEGVLDSLPKGRHEGWSGVFDMVLFDRDNGPINVSYRKGMGFWVNDQTVHVAKLAEVLTQTGTTVEELADGIIPRAYSDGTPTLAEWRNKLRDAVGLEAAQRSTNGKV